MKRCEDFPCCGHTICQTETVVGQIHKKKITYFCSCGAKVKEAEKKKYGIICKGCRLLAYRMAT